MPLISDIPDTQKLFLSNRRLVIDSSSAIKMVKDPHYQDVLLNLSTGIYHVYYPVWLLLEVGLGPVEKQHPNEKTLAELLYTRQTTHEDMKTRELRGEPESQFSSYVLSAHEYYQARRILQKVARNPDNSDRTSLVKLRGDALIFACARNLWSPLITENKKDFRLILENSEEFPRRLLPFFNLDELQRSFRERITFVYPNPNTGLDG